jgi:tetratricopeptide (TPR) repeat protein
MYSDLALAYIYSGDLKQAVDCGKKALDKKDAATYHKDASESIKSGEYGAAVKSALLAVSAAPADYSYYYYSSLPWFLLFKKQYATAEKAARKSLEFNSSYLFAKGNLAPSLLFQGKVEEAKKIYMDNMNSTLSDGRSFAKVALQDLDELEKAEAIPNEQKDNVKMIISLLNENTEGK